MTDNVAKEISNSTNLAIQQGFVNKDFLPRSHPQQQMQLIYKQII